MSGRDGREPAGLRCRRGRLPVQTVAVNQLFSLEFNLEPLILSDLTRNIGEALKNGDEAESTANAIDLVMSRAETRNFSIPNGANDTPRVFMVGSELSITSTSSS